MEDRVANVLADRAKAQGEGVTKAPKVKVERTGPAPDKDSPLEVLAEYNWSQHKREEAITFMSKAVRADSGNYELPGWY